MKLLLDENLSRRLVLPFLLNNYPDTTQVALLGMERSSDQEIWEYARLHGFVIVTRDSDYYELSTIHGQPPKIVWLRMGNQSKSTILSALMNHREAIEKVLIIDGKACIEVY